MSENLPLPESSGKAVKVFAEMPNQNSSNSDRPTPFLKRSARLRHHDKTRYVNLENPQYNTFSFSRNRRKLNVGSEGSAEPTNGSRRSGQLSAAVEGFSGLRRSLRLSEKGNLSDKLTSEADGINLAKQSVGKLEKKMIGSCNGDENAEKCREQRIDEIWISLVIDKEATVGVDSSEQVTVVANSPRGSLEVGIEEEQKRVGVKRKKNQVEEDHRTVQGWTKDQESALRKAYLTTKPTPHFWKKVSKMVPGKSAQDCFNKIHADQVTPPRHQPCSRAKIKTLSSLPLTPTKLRDSAGPSKKTDLFSVFEPTLSPSKVSGYSTPERNQDKPEFLKRCQERSSSALRKSLSRFNNSNESIPTSPPVLKQVKNKALHEKYIDHLQKRDAKRKAVAAKEAKSGHKKVDEKENIVQNLNVVEAAKNALLFGARDAISQFKDAQANAKSGLSDADEDEVFCSDEDEL